MKESPTTRCLLICALAMAANGCANRSGSQVSGDIRDYQTAATQLEYADVAQVSFEAPEATLPPLTVEQVAQTEYWDMTLEESVRLALINSKVMRDLGGTVLRSPDAASTIFSPALTETDARFGVEASLSAFDAIFQASALWEKNDRSINNRLLGGGARLLQQDLGNYITRLSKRTATGGELAVQHTWDYDANNADGNEFPSAWTVKLDAEFRQPLLQGAGAEFNRIMGPDALPGLPRGVLVARINTDISLAEFQAAVRDLVSDVETAYWELYFAYRDLNTKIAARDRALRTWRVIEDWRKRGRVGGEADKEAAAREQYYRLEAEVQEALAGKLLEPNRSNVFRGSGGVQSNERRLRLLIGVPINDGRLIRTIDDPHLAQVVFSWPASVAEAIERSPELNRQRWKIKREQLVLYASRNFLLPEVDALGRYRWRGFGKDLIAEEERFFQSNAFADLMGGGFQEWQLGVEMRMPVGFRQGHAAVRNAELLVAREHAILEEQTRHVVHNLSAGVAEVARAFKLARTNEKRLEAARDQLRALEALAEDPDPNQLARLIDQLLDSQRRLTDAESRYYRTLAEHAVAVKTVHYNKGSLLEYSGVYLTEGPWTAKAMQDAAERRRLQWELRQFQHPQRGPVVTRGPAAQAVAAEGIEIEVPSPLPPVDGAPLPGANGARQPDQSPKPLRNEPVPGARGVSPLPAPNGPPQPTIDPTARSRPSGRPAPMPVIPASFP